MYAKISLMRFRCIIAAILLQFITKDRHLGQNKTMIIKIFVLDADISIAFTSHSRENLQGMILKRNPNLSYQIQTLSCSPDCLQQPLKKFRCNIAAIWLCSSQKEL